MHLTIERKQKSSNFTGLSLVMFLFLSMLSMMAAFEAGKSTDEIRGTTIVSLNEYPSPGADTETDHQTLLPRGEPSNAPPLSVDDFSRTSLPLRVALAQSAFDARAPPAQTTPAS
ncbi:MAG: hypothetical protein K2Y29_21645 [Beijerinckiaceae bacterium]|nr:hypothetical protein [Beijerinckiaceae bacterium]